MVKVFNKLFNVLKVFLLLLDLIIILYITLFMYYRLGKNVFDNSFFEFCGIMLPFVVLLTLFAINFSLKQKDIINDTFYNCSCVIAFLTILFINYRTLGDQNMIFRTTEGFNINFTYFSDQITQVKTLVYLMSLTNILLIIKNKLFHKKEINVI